MAEEGEDLAALLARLARVGGVGAAWERRVGSGAWSWSGAAE
jgi:hypothetical protein